MAGHGRVEERSGCFATPGASGRIPPPAAAVAAGTGRQVRKPARTQALTQDAMEPPQPQRQGATLAEHPGWWVTTPASARSPQVCQCATSGSSKQRTGEWAQRGNVSRVPSPFAEPGRGCKRPDPCGTVTQMVGCDHMPRLHEPPPPPPPPPPSPAHPGCAGRCSTGRRLGLLGAWVQSFMRIAWPTWVRDAGRGAAAAAGARSCLEWLQMLRRRSRQRHIR